MDPREVERPPPPRSRKARRILLAAVVLVLASFVVLRWIVVPYRILGSSMLPTLVGTELGQQPVDGDIVLVNRLAYLLGRPGRWEVVVIEQPAASRLERSAAGEAGGAPLENVKRIVGLPGETVEIQGGSVRIDGSRIELPPALRGTYIVSKGPFGRGSFTLADDEYFVLGDNSYLSRDSRYWGPVARRAIQGRAILIVFPCRRFGRVP